MNIGVFDSGLGGITVLKKLYKKFPKNNYIYYADLKNIPYGSKSNDKLVKIAINILEKLEKYDIDLYICACGTLSSITFNEMNEYLKLKNKKLCTIVDPICNSVKKIAKKDILLIATEATIKNKIFEKHLKEKCPNLNIYIKACTDMVPLIENNMNDEKLLQALTNKYLKNYVSKVDTIVCGCTHYILFEKYIKNVLGNVNIIEAGNAIVDDIGKQYELEDNYNDGMIKIIGSKENEQFRDNVKHILNTKNIEFLLD